MAKKKQKDDLSAISNSFKKQKPAKNLEEIKQIARAVEKKSPSPTPPAPAPMPATEAKLEKISHRTTINLPINTYKGAKKHCVDIGKTLTDYIADLIEKDLE